MLFGQLKWTFVTFAAISAIGVLGYRFIEGWDWLDSAWMVTITLTTIGYGEVHPLSPLGKAFTIGLVSVGLGLVTVTFGQVTSYLVEGRLLEELRARRRLRIMQRLSDHVVVVGSGRLGREVTAELMARQVPVVVIESHPDAKAGESSLGEIEPTLLLIGDGSDDDVLERACVRDARAIAVATGSDATNVFVTLTARQMNPRLHIVTRVADERTVVKAIRAGADAVINPYGLSGVRMAQGVLHPTAAQLLDQAIGRDHAEFQIGDVLIGEVPEYNGALGDLDIPQRHGIQLLALRAADGELKTSLGRNTQLSPGDVAVVVGRPSNVKAFSLAAKGLSDSET